MSRVPSHGRSLLVALAAMAGMVWGAPDALAGSSGTKPAAGCCTRPMPAGCECCPPAGQALPSPALPAAPSPTLSDLGPGSGESCVCRPAQPAQRDTRQDSRSSEQRTPDPIDELPLAATAFTPRPASSAPAFAAVPPPRTALFLRIERLLL